MPTANHQADYAEIYARSLQDPQGFWGEQASRIPWITEPKTVLDQDENGVWRWFPDGELNSCYVALDQHVAQGRGDQTALIYDSPVTNTVEHFTFSQLLAKPQPSPVVLSNLV